MDKNKLYLYLFGISYAITLGSLVYIIPTYKELWFFLEIITLPFIYMIGYEILMHEEKKKMKKEYENIKIQIENIMEENYILKAALY